MAKEKISRTICDRCARVVEELDTGKEDASREGAAPKYYVEVSGGKALSFEDLCKKCDDRVASLLEDMKLEKPAKADKPSKSDKKSAKKDGSAAKDKDKGKPSTSTESSPAN